MDRFSINFKAELSKNKDLLNSILSEPKNKKDLFLYASDAAIELVLEIVYLTYNRTIKSPDSFFQELRDKKKMKYLTNRFNHEKFDILKQESRRKKIKTLLFLWPVLPSIISLLKKKQK